MTNRLMGIFMPRLKSIIALCFLLGYCNEVEARRYLGFLDVSGSMSGARIRAAKEGAKLFVSMLESSDTVQLVSFSDTASVSPVFTLNNTGQTDAAQRWIDGLQTTGGTDYVAALGAVKVGDQTIGVFLSDGHHDGPGEKVLACLRKIGRAKIHTIGIENSVGGSGESLLRRMASATGGSYCRVESSEELVRRFADIAIQAGRYRGHRPTETSLHLKNASGRVLGFAFDGGIDAVGASTVNRYSADLPGEDVSLVVASMKSAAHLKLSLRDATTSRSRLGEVFVGHLPKHKFRVVTPGDSLPSGGLVRSVFDFEDATGQAIDPRARTDISAQVEVVAVDGKVLDQVQAVPSRSQPALEATVPVPNANGVTLRGVSTVVDRGKPFIQSDEQTYTVKPAPAFVVNPSRLQFTGPPGKVSRSVSATWKESGGPTESISARIEAADHVRLVSSNAASGTIEIVLECLQAGVSNGNIVLTALSDGVPSEQTIPFQLDIRAPQQGLSLPPKRAVDLGTCFADGIAGKKTLTFLSLDDVPFEYDVTVRDLASSAHVISLQSNNRVIRPDSKQASNVNVHWNPIGAVAGEYAGSLTVTSASMKRSWVSDLKLTVMEPLSAQPIDLGNVAPGDVIRSSVVLTNKARTVLQSVQLQAPIIASTRDDDLTISLSRITTTVPAGRSETVPFKLAVSPLLTEYRRIDTHIKVRRGATAEMSIPLTFHVVDPATLPKFEVTPQRLELRGRPKSVVQFTMIIKAAKRHSGTARLTAASGEFRDVNDAPVKVVSSVEWTNDTISANGRPASLTGFLVAPEQAGRYSGRLTITSSSGKKEGIPFFLTVDKEEL